jgi:hypothetical protein
MKPRRARPFVPGKDLLPSLFSFGHAGQLDPPEMYFFLGEHDPRFEPKRTVANIH